MKSTVICRYNAVLVTLKKFNYLVYQLHRIDPGAIDKSDEYDKFVCIEITGTLYARFPIRWVALHASVCGEVAIGGALVYIKIPK